MWIGKDHNKEAYFLPVDRLVQGKLSQFENALKAADLLDKVKLVRVKTKGDDRAATDDGLTVFYMELRSR